MGVFAQPGGLILAHLTARDSYARLSERLNRFPQGAPPSQLLFRILALLFSEDEAGLVAQLPVRPFSASQAAQAWKLPEARARSLLEGLAERALLVDIEQPDGMRYVLPPPMAGFFEFALMRVRGDIDQTLLSELYHQYISVEEDFIRDLCLTGETQFGRILVQEPAVADRPRLEVLDYDRASAIIATADTIGVGLCYCRHKAWHRGTACAAPLEICLTFGPVSASLIRHGQVRRIDPAEGLDLLQAAYAQNLVQFGENVREGVGFICNCCGCCCEALLAARRFGTVQTLHTSHFLATVDAARCSGCGRCVSACPLDLVGLETEHPQGRGRKRATVDTERCLGCGVCARVCPLGAMAMTARTQRTMTPLNTAHRTVLMAIERGRLQHLIFDNRVLWSHRALAALLGAMLRLPPVKRNLAGSQIGSRYLEALVRRWDPLRGTKVVATG
jgi:NAD-dependent dihydropyrimidine dehydrogenase PreA subunit